MKEILYVGFYDFFEKGRKIRGNSLAAYKKMDYIADTLVKLGYKVHFVSPAVISGKDEKYEHERTVEIRRNVKVSLTPSFGAKNKLLRATRLLFSRVWLTMYLLLNTKPGDKVLVYHNYELTWPIIISKFIRKYTLIYEIEEIYSKVWNLSKYQEYLEGKLLSLATHNSIVVSDKLKEYLGLTSATVCYGPYTVNDECLKSINKRNIDKSINMIFTGSIDNIRGGAFLAIEALKRLPNNYHLKLSGPVMKESIESLKNAIDLVNIEKGEVVCEYLGVLSDEEYKKLLNTADIALNTQKEGTFATFLFPSKILTYLAHNLRVVSTKGESIIGSSIADLLWIPDDYRPEEIANTILKVDFNQSYNSIERLRKLDEEFLRNIRNILI